MNKGKLIVIEGAGDGIGKTTQYTMLREKLASAGYDVACHHFPSYGTAQAALTEKYLRGEYGPPKSISPYVVNNIYAVDRMITWHTLLRERYEAGCLILLDRYTTSSLIYQSAYIADEDERRRFIEYVTDFEFSRLGIASPDAVVFLTAPYETIEKMRRERLANEGIEHDIHESDGEFMKLIYSSALFVSSYLGWSTVECADADGTVRTREDIHRDVMSALLKEGIL